MLTLVPPTELSPKQAFIERIKARHQPDGMWQCNRCGSRTSMTSENGVITKNGRKQRGTVIVKDVCAMCWKQDIHSPMQPTIERIK